MPEIDAGRFPAKRAVGETVRVEADIFADGHDALAAVVKYKLLPARGEEVPPPHLWGGAGRSPAEGQRRRGRAAGEPPGGPSPGWIEVPMTPLINDRWQAEFPVTELGRYLFTIEGWVDHFETWSRQLAKRIQAGQDVAAELEVGARMIEEAASRATSSDGDSSRLRGLAKSLRT